LIIPNGSVVNEKEARDARLGYSVAGIGAMAEPMSKKSSHTLQNYRLSTSFPYLARRVGVRIGELFELAVTPLGIDVPTYRVLAALREEDGQRLGDLSKRTDIPLPTLSRLVGSMSQQGLIKRARPESNGRIVAINLLPAGRSLVEALIPVAIRLEQAAVTGLKAAEIALLKGHLARAFENLDAAEVEIRSGGDLALIAQRIANDRQARKRA
jgi:MarR family transcriptional regulator, organic hydroperoxide resistance regulator